jgi:hypothetical protein
MGGVNVQSIFWQMWPGMLGMRSSARRFWLTSPTEDEARRSQMRKGDRLTDQFADGFYVVDGKTSAGALVASSFMPSCSWTVKRPGRGLSLGGIFRWPLNWESSGANLRVKSRQILVAGLVEDGTRRGRKRWQPDRNQEGSGRGGGIRTP